MGRWGLLSPQWMTSFQTNGKEKCDETVSSRHSASMYSARVVGSLGRLEGWRGGLRAQPCVGGAFGLAS